LLERLKPECSSLASERAISFPLAKVRRDHPLLQQHDEVPLGGALILRLHRPHHPARSLISELKRIDLCDEVTSEEVDVFVGKAVVVAVVIRASRFTGIWRDIWGVESSIEVFLALGHSQTELSDISWPVQPN